METYLTVFIALTAVAVLIQGGALLAIYLRMAKLDEETKGMRRRLEERVNPILDDVNDVTTTVRENARLIFDDLSGLSSDARRQVQKFDMLTDEMADRLRQQIIRLDDLLTQAMRNLERAGVAVRENVSGPVREAAAVIQGVRAAIDFLSARRERQRTGRRAADEELFI